MHFFYNEDEKINQQNAQINSGLILLLINHSNMFRPLSRIQHQGVNIFNLPTFRIFIIINSYFQFKKQFMNIMKFKKCNFILDFITCFRSKQWLCNSQGFRNP